MRQNRGSKKRQYERGKKMHKAEREKEGAAWLIVAYAKEPMMPASFIELHWECQVGGRFGGKCDGAGGKRGVKTSYNLEHLGWGY